MTTDLKGAVERAKAILSGTYPTQTNDLARYHYATDLAQDYLALHDLVGELVGARRRVYAAINASVGLRTHPDITAVKRAMRGPDELVVRLQDSNIAREAGLVGEEE